MLDVHVHLLQWVLGRGNELELPRAGITLMTLSAALCALTSDLFYKSIQETHTHTHMHGHTQTHTDTFGGTSTCIVYTGTNRPHAQTAVS